MEPETKPSLSARISPWLRRLHAVLTSFWADVVSLFPQVRTPNKDAAETVHPQHTPAPEAQRSEGGSTPLVINPITNPQNAENNRQHNTPRWEKAAVLIAFGLLVVNFFQMRSTEKAAEAAKSAADIAKKQLGMLRPWIVSEFAPTGLTFNEGGGFLGLNITVTNTGNSVAKSISAWTELWFNTGTLLWEEKRYCEIPKSPENNPKNPIFKGGSDLFPGQHYTFSQPAAAPRETIEKALTSGDFKDERKVVIYVVTCIDYKSTLDDEHHQTRRYFLLIQPDPVRNAMKGVFDPHGTYAPNQFSMIPAGVGNGSVD